MNVLNLPGPEFLKFYVTLMAVSVLGGLAWRWAMRAPFSEAPAGAAPLDVFEIAYLAGGPAGLANAVLASLVHRGLAKVGPAGVTTDGQERPGLHPLEQHALLAARRRGKPERVTLTRFRSLVPAAAPRHNLEDMGLVLPPRRRLLASLVPALAAGAVLALGVAKIGVGLSRGKPVAFLLILCFICGAAAWGFCHPSRRTVRGTRLLDALRGANVSLRTTARSGATSLTAPDVALAVSLWGPAMLTGIALKPLHDVLAPTASSGSSCSSGSCGGGGCGGGCGGCGG